jgi:hypothetical protein
LREKGDKRRTIGLQLRRGPGHPRIHPSGRTDQRAALPAAPAFAYRGVRDRFNGPLGHVGPKGHLGNVPNALRERELPSGEKTIECVYTPHSLRAIAATLLLDSAVDIMEVKDCSVTAMSPPPRSTTRGGALHARGPHIRWRYEDRSGKVKLAPLIREFARLC